MYPWAALWGWRVGCVLSPQSSHTWWRSSTRASTSWFCCSSSWPWRWLWSAWASPFSTWSKFRTGQSTAPGASVYGMFLQVREAPWGERFLPTPSGSWVPSRWAEGVKEWKYPTSSFTSLGLLPSWWAPVSFLLKLKNSCHHEESGLSVYERLRTWSSKKVDMRDKGRQRDGVERWGPWDQW